MTQKNEFDALLAQQYFLSGLDKADRNRLIANAVRWRLEPEQALFHQGDAADYFFVVLGGRIKLYRLAANGTEKTMGLVGPGKTFAEGVLFMPVPRYPVNAQALEATRVAGISRAAYRRLLEASSSTCFSVMGKLTERIQGLLNEIETLTLQDSRYRVARYLTGLMPENPRSPIIVQLPARKSEIAARLGLRPETLSRAFKALADDRLLRVGDTGQIEILDPERLCGQQRT